MKVKCLLLFLIVLMQPTGFAQDNTVSGYLLSKKNNEPISFANISFLKKNSGTITNKEGFFEFTFNSDSATLKFSSIGFKDSTIVFNGSKDSIMIYLEEISYILNEVVVDPYTYAEKFILAAIKAKNKQRSLLKFYVNDAYSKETIHAIVRDTMRVLGIMESVSQHSFLPPNKYHKKILALSKSKNMKNVPYSAFVTRQKIDLQNEYSQIANFSIINPLSSNALNYYNFYLEKKLISTNNEMTIIKIAPKREDIPLFEGTLLFNSSKKLMEANLIGNSQVADAVFDSLVLNQKFSIHNKNYNMPHFLSFSMQMNFGIISFSFRKMESFTNYKINAPLNKPIITSNEFIGYALNSDINLELIRKEQFKIPLTLEENKFNKRMDRFFDDPSIFKKAFFFLILDLPPLLYDTPTNFLGFDISKFSNFYRFNKVEGHFFGIEKEFNFGDEITNYTNLGYGLSSKIVHFNNDFIWNYFRVNIKNEISTLGKFNTHKTSQTILGLTRHIDNYHYFYRKLIKIGATIPLLNNLELTTEISFELKEGVDNNTNFSIFTRNTTFKPNYNFTNYNSNNVTFGLTYSTDPNYLANLQKNYKGKSTFLLSAKMKFFNKDLLNSSESFFGWEVYSKLYLELSRNIKTDISLIYFNQKGSNHISQYRFTNRKRNVSFQYKNISNFSEIIPFYTLNDYQHTVSEYLFIRSKTIWFYLPKISFMRISFSTMFSYLKSFSLPSEIIGSNLENDFFEYGIGIEGISFLNVYLVSNSSKHRNVTLQFGFMF